MDINEFFKALILDTLKKLPAEKYEMIQKVNLDKVFSTDYKNWKKTIKEVLNLSDTIEIAIKDLWLRNSAIAKNEGTELSENEFAELFIVNYYSEDSKVDSWESESDLNDAKKRIAQSILRE